jgi:hypothetical protein
MRTPPLRYSLAPQQRMDIPISDLLETSADEEGSISFEYSWDEKGSRKEKQASAASTYNPASTIPPPHPPSRILPPPPLYHTSPQIATLPSPPPQQQSQFVAPQVKPQAIAHSVPSQSIAHSVPSYPVSTSSPLTQPPAVQPPVYHETLSAMASQNIPDSSFSDALGDIGTIGENTCMEVFGALNDSPSRSYSNQSQSNASNSQSSFGGQSQRRVKKRIAPTFIGHAPKHSKSFTEK